MHYLIGVDLRIPPHHLLPFGNISSIHIESEYANSFFPFILEYLHHIATNHKQIK